MTAGTLYSAKSALSQKPVGSLHVNRLRPGCGGKISAGSCGSTLCCPVCMTDGTAPLQKRVAGNFSRRPGPCMRPTCETILGGYMKGSTSGPNPKDMPMKSGLPGSCADGAYGLPMHQVRAVPFGPCRGGHPARDPFVAVSAGEDCWALFTARVDRPLGRVTATYVS